MHGDGGQSESEAETIGQVYILTHFAKLLTKETLAVQRLPHQRFRRWHVHVHRIDPRARKSPTSAGNVLLHSGPSLRVILLEPHVVDGAFVVESIVRILFEAFEVFEKGVRHKLANRVLHRPIPLRVEMRSRYYIEPRLRILFGWLASCILQSCAQQNEHA